MKPWMTNNEYRYGPGVENSFGLWECSLMRLLNFCGNFLFKLKLLSIKILNKNCCGTTYSVTNICMLNLSKNTSDCANLLSDHIFSNITINNVR